ncbi:SDR family NAD(P)-dependent oxidoreductase [Sandarakinorhabdus sp.]|jgi:NAD(P)-dependent dehydrogenase (short-subunit alcohol dehydrogenase family)|uniref:SDR family NAD(P)-dependent oxidoreductase n=1 Tax=Sandarakinorhabdus sp. TaxID=1916663 RepID=UPI00333E8F8A
MALLVGKVAIVTGGGRGLGRCHALALAANGAAVVVNDLGGAVTGGGPDENGGGAADAVVAEILAAGGQAVANRASVADWARAESIIADAVAAFGRLDIVVNNAGINRPASLIDLTEADYDLETGVHLKGTTAVCHHAARLWAREGRQEGRAIINTTSPVGVHPMREGGPYCAAKAGIAALTVVAAQELAHLGVRANAIAPAARTRMVMASPAVDQLMPRSDGFDRHLPDHVSPLVVYLASHLNRFTGRVFGVEGPDVALYQPWSADWLVTGDGHWPVDALAEALATLPQQAPIRAFYPGGRIDTRIPPNRSLKALQG